MIRLAVALVRAGGWPRMLLLAGCTAVVSSLLLVVATMALLPSDPQEYLNALVLDPGTRGGTAFATALLTLPALLLLHQAVRLGTAARERRLAGLRLAGATPGEVRGLGAIEVGIPSLAGSLVGLLVFGLLRTVLGGTPRNQGFPVGSHLALVPTSATPTWWQTGLVVLGVAVLGTAVGLLASRRLILSPLGISRRQPPPPPRPWGLLILLLAVPLASVATNLDSNSDAQLAAMGLVLVAVLSLVSLAPWTAYRMGRFVEGRATSPELLMAARRLVVEPRPAGRAAAAVGGIALVAGGASGIAADLGPSGNVESFYVVSLGLVGVALLGALLVVTGTLAVHSVESLLDRKRSVAALRALGTPQQVLEGAQRWEAALVAMPMALVGVVLGSAAVGAYVMWSPFGLLLVLVTIAGTLALVWCAIVIATRATRPWVRRSGLPTNLRTE